ncbi:unknown [Acetobacter sp. CAG:267]|nr:unknown [Acetobacter sp. CAG:267]
MDCIEAGALCLKWNREISHALEWPATYIPSRLAYNGRHEAATEISIFYKIAVKL